MRIQLVVASRHGSTREIGEAIARTLREDGHEVDVLDLCPDGTPRPAEYAENDGGAETAKEPQEPQEHGYDAYVLGSAVYLMRWLDPLADWVAEHRDILARTPHAAFSVGLTGVRPALPTGLDPRDHVFFRGSIDPEVIADTGGTGTGGHPVPTGVAGDWRDWSRIAAWAAGLPARFR